MGRPFRSRIESKPAGFLAAEESAPGVEMGKPVDVGVVNWRRETADCHCRTYWPNDDEAKVVRAMPLPPVWLGHQGVDLKEGASQYENCQLVGQEGRRVPASRTDTVGQPPFLFHVKRSVTGPPMFGLAPHSPFSGSPAQRLA